MRSSASVRSGRRRSRFSILQAKSSIASKAFSPPTIFSPNSTSASRHAAFKSGKFDESEKWFKSIVDKFPNSDSAAEAQYWAGVSRYQRSHDPAELKATGEAFKKRYSDSTWAKKASIWT